MWIQLFNFKVWYILEKRHSTADDLFCRFRNKLINEKEKYKKDIDDFINVQLNYLWIASIVKNTSLMILLIIKVFLFDFKNADRENMMIEEDKITEGQDVRDCKNKLEEESSSDTEEV